jgi:hypothetical protein
MLKKDFIILKTILPVKFLLTTEALSGILVFCDRKVQHLCAL